MSKNLSVCEARCDFKVISNKVHYRVTLTNTISYKCNLTIEIKAKKQESWVYIKNVFSTQFNSLTTSYFPKLREESLTCLLNESVCLFEMIYLSWNNLVPCHVTIFLRFVFFCSKGCIHTMLKKVAKQIDWSIDFFSYTYQCKTNWA